MQGYYVSMVVQGKRTQQSPQSYFTSSLTLIEETSFNPNCTDTLQLKDYVFHADDAPGSDLLFSTTSDFV